MAQADIPRDTLKQVLKEALTETLSEQRGLFRDVFSEVIEDLGLIEAIERGANSEPVGRDQIFDALDDHK